jgi:hypothetical protein
MENTTKVTSSHFEFQYQTEFPIADERYHNYFNTFLTLTNSIIERNCSRERDELVIKVIEISCQLEKSIDILSQYGRVNSLKEVTLGSYPISYTLKVFSENLATLRKIRLSIEKELEFRRPKTAMSKNIEAKEFNPG